MESEKQKFFQNLFEIAPRPKNGVKMTLMGVLQLKEHVCLPPMIFSLFFEKMWKVEHDPHLCDFFLKGFTAENLKHRFFGKMQKLNAHRRACIYAKNL